MLSTVNGGIRKERGETRYVNLPTSKEESSLGGVDKNVQKNTITFPSLKMKRFLDGKADIFNSILLLYFFISS